MLEKFERYPLTFGPTHIEKLERLGAHLGGKVELYAKREDCNSGLAFGGNKLRKLEYIIPDAIASNADTLVSIGGVQSNHTRMVAAVAAKIGMKCRLVQESWVPHEDPVYDRVGNILLSRIMGADVQMVDEGFDIGIRQSWEEAIADVKAKGGKPYAIPAGASVHKYGTAYTFPGSCTASFCRTSGSRLTLFGSAVLSSLRKTPACSWRSKKASAEVTTS